MQIQNIEAEARDLCDADSTSYPAASMLRRVNTAYETVVGWIINADGTWQFDDTNYTNYPIGTFTLTNGVGRYSFNDQFLQLEEVQIMNSAGNYEIVPSIDQKETNDFNPLTEQYETAGKPIFYDKVADDTIELLPPPSSSSVTLASGLRIRFKRTADLYTSAQQTTGTKEPGFASPFHIIIAWMVARPYCLVHKPQRVPELNALIGDTTLEATGMKAQILQHYGRREKDKRKVMTMKQTSFR